jgi:hypothetical protein
LPPLPEIIQGGSEDYVLLVVRRPGERLAQFIDSKSKEFVFDLASVS